MKDYTDLSRYDNEALYTIVLLHEAQIKWCREDIERILKEMISRYEAAHKES